MSLIVPAAGVRPETVVQIIDKRTGVPLNYFMRSMKPDGTPITDADTVDSPIYIKNETTGLYYERCFEDYVNVAWWGAKADANATTGNGFDNTQAFSQAIAVAAMFRKTLYVPQDRDNPTGLYRITSPLNIPAGVSVNMEGTICYDRPANDNSAAIVVGGTTYVTNQRFYVFRIVKPTSKFSDWLTPDGNNAGIQFINVVACGIHVFLSQGFTNGILAEGVVEGTSFDRGFTYNDVTITCLWNNRVDIHCRTRRVSGTGIPFVNQNAWWGGNLASPSGGGTIHNGKSRYGVWINQSDGTGSHNNNTFHNFSFEKGRAAAAPGEAMPIIHTGNVVGHAYLRSRSEANTAPYAARLTGTVNLDEQGNDFHFSYNENMTDIDDQTNAVTNIFRSGSDIAPTRMDTVINIGDLSKRIKGYSSSGRMIPGMSFIEPNSSPLPVAFTSNVSLGSNGRPLFSLNTFAGILVDSSEIKTYYVSKKSTGSCRIKVVAYDANMVPLGTNTPPFPVNANVPIGFSAIATLTASYVTQSDTSDGVIFRFLDSVKYAFIGVANGSVSGVVGFEVKSLNKAVENILITPGYDQAIASASPSFGNYKAGELVLNVNNTTGALIGWQCSATGFATNTPWISANSYATGDVVHNSGRAYLAITGGTGGTTGPTQTSGTYTDGGATWLYLANRAIFITCVPDASLAQSGVVNTGSQNFAGDKTFNGVLAAYKAVAAAQAIIGYDTSNFLSMTVNSTGSVTFALTGSNASRTFSFTQAAQFPGGITAGSTANNLYIGTVSDIFITTLARYLFGGASSVQGRVGAGGSTTGALAASNSYGTFIVPTSTVSTNATGTGHAVVSNLVAKGPTITNGGTAAANGSAIYIEGPSTGATNNWALHIESGDTKLPLAPASTATYQKLVQNILTRRIESVSEVAPVTTAVNLEDIQSNTWMNGNFLNVSIKDFVIFTNITGYPDNAAIVTKITSTTWISKIDYVKNT